MFFDQNYVFKGKHAKYVNELKEHIFNRNLDVLLLAPVLGLVYNRKSSIDKDSEFVDLDTKVFAEQMLSEQEKLLFNYRLCMLLNNEKSEEERKDNAFKYYTELDTSDDSNYYDDHEIEISKKRMEENFNEYNAYILGGVEVLYERLLDDGKATDSKDIIKIVTEFISDFNDEAEKMDEDMEEWD